MKKYFLILVTSVLSLHAAGQINSPTGAYTTTNANISLYTSAATGTLRMRILTSNGFVGIGNVTTPGEMLQVNGNILATGTGNISATGNLQSIAGILNVNHATNPFILQLNASEKLRVLSSGNVGIGITPTERLHVSGGNILTTGNLITTAGILNVNSATNPLTFQTNGTDRMRIMTTGTNAGYVGIGNTITNPSEMLQVGGNITASGTISSASISTGGVTSGGPILTTAGIFGTYSANPLLFQSNSSTKMTILSSGNVGIGTTNPGQMLEVNGNILTSGSIATTSGIVNASSTTNSLQLQTNGTTKMTITSGGNVGIGTTTPGTFKLAVNGAIAAKDLQILNTTGPTWPDYVFSKEYKLPSLQNVEKYIKQNKHLEGVPSAEEIKENGYSAATLDQALLKKVEELTLYVIEQQKQIEALQKEVSEKGKRK